MRAILTFHSVDPSGSVLSIEPEALRSLVRAIRRSGHTIVPLADILADPARRDRIALTFDDGMASVPRSAAPVLREESAPATLFVTTDYLGHDNQWPTMPAHAPRMAMARWDEVEALHAEGWAIEAHTCSHPDLRRLSDAALEDELGRSDEAIEKHLGRRPSIFAYPYGDNDPRVVDAVSRRYEFAVTARMGTLPARLDEPHRVPRLETFYFRSPAVHRFFGSAVFGAYLALRKAVRELRGG